MSRATLFPAGPSRAEWDKERESGLELESDQRRINAEFGDLARELDGATFWGPDASILSAEGEAVWVPMPPAEVVAALARPITRDGMAAASAALLFGGLVLGRVFRD